MPTLVFQLPVLLALSPDISHVLTDALNHALSLPPSFPVDCIFTHVSPATPKPGPVDRDHFRGGRRELLEILNRHPGVET